MMSALIAPNAELVQTLASDVLFLRGMEASVFAEQFAVQAARPVAIHIAGDSESFRQALCFPVRGSVQDGFVQPAATSAAPYLLVELHSGHVICLRLADCAASRFSLNAFLRSIERSLERLPRGITSWPGTEDRKHRNVYAAAGRPGGFCAQG